MLLQIQGNGEVFGSYNVPETVPPSPLTPEEFSSHLALRLKEEVVVDGVESSPLSRPYARAHEVSRDRVIVNLDELKVDGTFKLSVIHEAVGLVAAEHLLQA